MSGVRRDVDRAALRPPHGVVAVRVEVRPLQGDPERAARLAQPQVQVPGVVAPVARFEERGSRLGPARDHVHHATQRVVAPDARATAAHHLDLLDAEPRDAAPVHPAAERVVDRDLVQEHQGPAGAAGSGEGVTERGHRTVPHPADTTIEAWGPTRGACLAEAGECNRAARAARCGERAPRSVSRRATT